MALKWFLNSTFTHVLGHTQNVGMIEGSGIKEGKERNVSMVSICKEEYPNGFQMPLHYPKYNKADYEKMEECKLDLLLKEYGFKVKGSLEEKRQFAGGAFLWPDQL
ncbi:hypothetical protein L484_018236 [Morus notabilis]|uniref:DUF7722 domain-containing protein n=1 Tax=Morus notabilis TaxID=981085 RepID=W9R1F4_9ROSA|nr:uncharacterized protein LOC21401211 [Morus notabilis]EXB36078.1 hypothetical protein L484_018236 [Morus notabilis]